MEPLLRSVSEHGQGSSREYLERNVVVLVRILHISGCKITAVGFGTLLEVISWTLLKCNFWTIATAKEIEYERPDGRKKRNSNLKTHISLTPFSGRVSQMVVSETRSQVSVSK